MGKLTLAIYLVLAPLMALLYEHAMVLFLNTSDVAKYLRKGGLINTDKLESYEQSIHLAAIFGLLFALLPARELARWFHSRRLDS